MKKQISYSTEHKLVSLILDILKDRASLDALDLLDDVKQIISNASKKTIANPNEIVTAKQKLFDLRRDCN